MNRLICLLVLAVQNSALILLLKYSQNRSGPRYHPSSLVCLSELTKIILALLLEANRIAKSEMKGKSLIARHIGHSLMARQSALLILPAFLYAIQNNLCFVAVGLLTPVNYQLIYQAKILTTALFSLLLLGKRLGRRHWLALLLLLVGVVLVQVGGSVGMISKHRIMRSREWIGFVLLMINSVTSGFAGVYFEKITKRGNFNLSPRLAPLTSVKRKGGEVVVLEVPKRDYPLHEPLRSIWVQSVELAVFGLAFSLLLAYLGPDRHRIHLLGFFHGIDRLACLIFVMQAVSGLLVAVVIRYADNILKAFATSISIVISSLLPWCWRGPVDWQQPSGHSLVGSVLVILAVFIYADGERVSKSRM